MPELPEVESVRRGLARAKLSAPVSGIWRSAFPLRVGKTWRDEGLDALVGALPQEVRRRGKYILWRFSRARKSIGLVVHLGMSGRFGFSDLDTPRLTHTHFELQFTDGRVVRLVDPRRFGGLRAGDWDVLMATPPLSQLGPEPLARGFGGTSLMERAKSSTRIIRDVLLDQHVVAGVGNIYAVEALHLAGIHPLVCAHKLRDEGWHRLAAALRDVLRVAIRHGGTTLRDFRNVTGEVGRHQDELRVYGRAGQPCPSCGAILKGFVHGGRSGVFCPVEQSRRP